MGNSNPYLCSYLLLGTTHNRKNFFSHNRENRNRGCGWQEAPGDSITDIACFFVCEIVAHQTEILASHYSNVSI